MIHTVRFFLSVCYHLSGESFSWKLLKKKVGKIMAESNKSSNTVYRLRPIKILPGIHYKIIKQQGQEITLEVVPTNNEDIAKRLARLRYPELHRVMLVVTRVLRNALEDETRINNGASEGGEKICSELSRVVDCLRGTCLHLLSLSRLTQEDISSHERRVHPIQN